MKIYNKTHKKQYVRLSVIGRGGFGIVEEVQDENGLRYACKTFVAPIANSGDVEKLKKRFRREVLTQYELGGDEILPVLDYDLDCDEPWFVMPLAQATYREKISEDQFEGKITAAALGDILNALQKLHDLSYVHRDLNPNNILLHEGKWKLSDLGAILPPNGGTIVLTEDTAIFTESYCAPEQRKDFHKAKASADIYSFGCILHDLFGKGQRTPYAQHSATGDIGVLIEKCTHEDPLKRPGLSNMRSILLEILDNQGGPKQKLDDDGEEWLLRLDDIKNWTDELTEDFGRFFSSLDLEERENGKTEKYLCSDTTPFLTRLSQKTIKKLAEMDKGTTNAVIEKYCDWAGSTEFNFDFSDSVCIRLKTIVDFGNPSQAANAFLALVKLGYSHHRYFVMRTASNFSKDGVLKSDLAKRIALEIKIEDSIHCFKRCVEITDMKDDLNASFKDLLG